MRSSLIRLFPHGRCYSVHFYYFYMQEIFSGTIALAFLLCFSVPASSLLFFHYIITGFFYRFTITLLYSKLCFSFSGMRGSLFVCVAIITPFSCHMLLIPTPLALLSFVSIVLCAVSSSVLFFISFLFLYRFC